MYMYACIYKTFINKISFNQVLKKIDRFDYLRYSLMVFMFSLIR